MELPPASDDKNTFLHKEKLLLDAGGITGAAKRLLIPIYYKLM